MLSQFCFNNLLLMLFQVLFEVIKALSNISINSKLKMLISIKQVVNKFYLSSFQYFSKVLPKITTTKY